MPVRPTTCLAAFALAAAVAAGCGGSGSGGDATPAAATPAATATAAAAGLPVVRAGDLAGAEPQTPVDLADAQARVDFDRSRRLDTPGELARYRKLGLRRSTAVELTLGGGGGGFSTAEQYPSHAAAVEGNRPVGAPAGVRRKAVPGLDAGRVDTYRKGGDVSRNVYFVKGDLAFWIGYSSTRADEPGAAALVAAARKLAARAA